MKTSISRMVWPEVQEALKRGAAVMIPLASIEPSGRQSIMGGESFIVEHWCEGVTKKTGDIYLPAMPFGYAPSLAHFPGGVTLSNDTLVSVILDVVRSMHHHGFKHIMIVDNHSGNEAAVEQAARIIRDESGYILGNVLLPPIMKSFAEDLYEDLNSKHGHGGEPGVSVRQYLCPDDMRIDLAKNTEHQSFQGFKVMGNKVAFKNASFMLYMEYSQTNPHGGSGDPFTPDPEKGKIVLDRMIDWGADMMEEFKKLDLYSPIEPGAFLK